MLDRQGRLIEGTMSNVFLVSNDQIFTPSLNRCGVAGIIRDFIIKVLAKTNERCVIEKNITMAEMLASDEMFICNSLIGIWPVVAVGCHKKTVGPTTKKIQQLLTREEQQQLSMGSTIDKGE